MIGGGLKTGSRADRAVYVGRHAARAADDMVVVIPHARLVTRRMAGWLDAPDKAGILEDAQIVVNCLCGERAEPRPASGGDGLHVAMLPLAENRHEHGKARSCHS